MTSIGIRVLDPTTGELVTVCRGPASSGACPFTGKDGVVPCSGLLISPPDADPRLWPVYVPPGQRHCEFSWNDLASACLRKAEACRRKSRAGLDRETRRVTVLAAAGDPRYRRMTASELRSTARWRWRLSPRAQALSRSEEKQRERARMYLSFAEHSHQDAAGR